MEFIQLRRSGKVNKQISINLNRASKQIVILAEQGRHLRPLFIVEGGKLLLKSKQIKEIKAKKI